MKAILWDGQKQIKGRLELRRDSLSFNLVDFPNTNLDFDLMYNEIKKVGYLKMYKITNTALEIITIEDKVNVFVVEDPKALKLSLEKLMNEF